jgi:hypothetical protein
MRQVKMFKPMITATLAGMTVLVAAACAAVPRSGETVTLQGVLVLKGNEPFTTTALMVDDSELWELQNVPAGTAKRLQNKRVEVSGLVIRPSAIGVQLPSLRVSNLRAR